MHEDESFAPQDMPDIVGAYRSLLREESRPPSRSQMVRCSELGHVCPKYIALTISCGEQAARPDDILQGIFATGNLLEPILVRRLDEAGHLAARGHRFRLARQQTPVTGCGDLAGWPVSGTCDAVLEVECDDQGLAWKSVAACDIKTVSPGLFRMSDVSELVGHPLGRKWVVQVEAYALGLDLDYCLLVLVHKLNVGWDIRTIWWNVNHERIHDMLHRGQHCYELGQRGETPEGINRKAICNRCPFLNVCMPSFESTSNLLEDVELEELLDRREELLELHKEFGNVADRIKALLPESETIICGKWKITGKHITVREHVRKESRFMRRKYERID